MSLRVEHPVLRTKGVLLPLQVLLTLFLWSAELFGQQSPPKDGGAPKYDQNTEATATGTIDEINLIAVGSRKDFVQLVIKNGSDKFSAYICPKPFEDEMGITFSKGDRVTFTGSKVKREDADVILVRELVKGTDTLLFRDNKGAPVWDWRTGK